MGEANAAIPAEERAVLDAIYTQTNGANWLDHTGWEGAIGTERVWHDIRCTTASDQVIRPRCATTR